MKPLRNGPQTFRAALFGFAAGFTIGPASVFAVAAAQFPYRFDDWPGWAGIDLVVLLSLFDLLRFMGDVPVAVLLGGSVAAGVNGAVGAGLAAARGWRGPKTVIVFPAAIHVTAGVIALAVVPRDFMDVQILALFFTPLIWSAGRLGQRVGCTMTGRSHPAGGSHWSGFGPAPDEEW